MHTIVVWFRRDLRCHDNATLQRAVADADRVVPLYCLPERWTGPGMFDHEKVGPYRARFLRDSLADLRDSLRDRGGELYVRRGDPGTVVPAVAVYWQDLPGTEERTASDRVRSALSDGGVETRTFWTHTLYHRDDLPRPVEDIEDTFTPWKDRTEAKASPRPSAPGPDRLPAPERPGEDAIDPGSLPELADFGFDESDAAVDDRGVLDWSGGETAGLDRLEQYIWERDEDKGYSAGTIRPATPEEYPLRPEPEIIPDTDELSIGDEYVGPRDPITEVSVSSDGELFRKTHQDREYIASDGFEDLIDFMLRHKGGGTIKVNSHGHLYTILQDGPAFVGTVESPEEFTSPGQSSNTHSDGSTTNSGSLTEDDPDFDDVF